MNCIIAFNKKTGKYATLYSETENSFGVTPAIALIRADKKYCNLYGKLLKTFDMNHEVAEGLGVEEAMDLYGFCQDTIELAVIRMFPACGQHGYDQFEDWLYELDDSLDNPELYQLFYSTLKKELRRDEDVEMYAEKFDITSNCLRIFIELSSSLNIELEGTDLTNLAVLSKFTSIKGDLIIDDNQELKSLKGMDNLTSIGGDLIICNNNLLTNLTGLKNLTTIGGDLVIKDNDKLTNIDALNSITSIGGDLSIDDKFSLKIVS